MVILLKIKRRDFFSMRQHSYFGVPFVNAASPRTISVDKKKISSGTQGNFGVTHCENSKVKIPVFSK